MAVIIMNNKGCLCIPVDLCVQVFLVRKTNGKDSGQIFAMKVLKKVRSVFKLC